MGRFYTIYGVLSIHLMWCGYNHHRGDFMKEYWERLRELREDNDIKQSEIAKLLGTTQQVYSRYENGINEIPVHHIITLCKFYQVSADYILGIN